MPLILGYSPVFLMNRDHRMYCCVAVEYWNSGSPRRFSETATTNDAVHTGHGSCADCAADDNFWCNGVHAIAQTDKADFVVVPLVACSGELDYQAAQRMLYGWLLD
jgi:hypothetical protein